jgi:hypothetical protein
MVQAVQPTFVPKNVTRKAVYFAKAGFTNEV